MHQSSTIPNSLRDSGFQAYASSLRRNGGALPRPQLPTIHSPQHPLNVRRKVHWATRTSQRLKDAHDSWSGSQLRHLGQQLPTQGQGLGFPRKLPGLHSNRRSRFLEALTTVASSQDPLAKIYFDAFAFLSV